MRKTKVLTTTGMVLVLFALLVVASPARAAGNTPASLSSQGWTCVDVVLLDGTDVGVHCFPPGAFSSPPLPSISVKYFETSDPASNNAPYLGTEILIRADLYAGQPCPSGPEGVLDLNALLGIPYYGCHHPVGGP